MERGPTVGRRVLAPKMVVRLHPFHPSSSFSVLRGPNGAWSNGRTPAFGSGSGGSTPPAPTRSRLGVAQWQSGRFIPSVGRCRNGCSVHPPGPSSSGCGAVGSAPVWGTGGRQFESGQPDHSPGPVAQLAERRPFTPIRGGSTPSGPTILSIGIPTRVRERSSPGSSFFILIRGRSSIWQSACLASRCVRVRVSPAPPSPGRVVQLEEHLSYKQDVGGSRPSAPTFTPLGE